MKRNRVFSGCFLALAAALSHAMCAVVAYQYRAMLCAAQHQAASAPASVAFLLGLPFLFGIALCLVLALVLRRRASRAP